MTAQYGAINAPSLRDFSGNSMVGAGDYAIQMQQSQEAQTLNNLMAEQQFQHNQVMNPLTQQQMVGTNQATDLSNRLKAGTLNTDITEKNTTSQVKAAQNLAELANYAAQQLSMVPGPARASAFADMASKVGVPPELVQGFVNQPDIVGSLKQFSQQVALGAAKHQQQLGTIAATGAEQRATQQQALDAGKYAGKSGAKDLRSALMSGKLDAQKGLVMIAMAKQEAQLSGNTEEFNNLTQLEGQLRGIQETQVGGAPGATQRNLGIGGGRSPAPQGSQKAGGVIKLD